jgi:hypothetical protein
MVRLEKIDLSSKSWWAPCDSPPVLEDRDLDAFKTTSKKCDSCNEESKEIYNAGWTCLWPQCLAYFHLEREVDEKDLDYNEAFLKERSQFQGSIREPLVPKLLTDNDLEVTGAFGIERAYARGIVCPECQGCSRRLEWDRWTCEATPGCKFVHKISQKPVSVATAIGDSFTSAKTMCHNDIRSWEKNMGRYKVFEYLIPGPDGNTVGIIRHFKPDAVINTQIDGPDDLFMDMQTGRFGLKRNPARQKGGWCNSQSLLEFALTLDSYWRGFDVPLGCELGMQFLTPAPYLPDKTFRAPHTSTAFQSFPNVSTKRLL